MSMARAPVAVLPSEDLLAVVRVHANRLHDYCRRHGCTPVEAAAVVETSARDLVDAVAAGSFAVGEPIGWWYAQGHRRVHQVVGGVRDELLDDPDDSAASNSTGSDSVVSLMEEAPARALRSLSDEDRTLLLLRDSYDLEPVSVADAVDLDLPEVFAVLAAARMHLLTAYDSRRVPALGRHDVDLPALGRLADGSPGLPGDFAARAHAAGCPTCTKVLDAQIRARRLLASMPVISLPDDERDDMLKRVARRTNDALPHRSVLTAAAEVGYAHHRRRWPTVVAVALTVAGVGGGLVALTAARESEQRALAALPIPTVAPQSQPPSPPPTVPPVALPRPVPTVIVPPTARPVTPSVRPSPTAQPLGALGLSVSPTSGPNGASLLVVGSGWQPGRRITLRYLRADGRTATGSTAAAVADASGTFRVQLVARDPRGAPGTHFVSAMNGVSSLLAAYNALT